MLPCGEAGRFLCEGRLTIGQDNFAFHPELRNSA